MDKLEFTIEKIKRLTPEQLNELLPVLLAIFDDNGPKQPKDAYWNRIYLKAYGKPVPSDVLEKLLEIEAAA